LKKATIHTDSAIPRLVIFIITKTLFFNIFLKTTRM